jgi:DNA-directed RNA polymerase specialized sigma subunit
MPSNLEPIPYHSIAEAFTPCQTSRHALSRRPVSFALAARGKIAGGYANIPGMTIDDVRAVAQAALHRAALAFDPARGAFEPYAARAIRNALNSLHQKEARHARQHLPEADLALAASTRKAAPRPASGCRMSFRMC